ncbi:hypothetical protein OSTOST_10614 [Ostertagia ostertagi]
MVINIHITPRERERLIREERQRRRIARILQKGASTIGIGEECRKFLLKSTVTSGCHFRQIHLQFLQLFISALPHELHIAITTSSRSKMRSEPCNEGNTHRNDSVLNALPRKKKLWMPCGGGDRQFKRQIDLIW